MTKPLHFYGPSISYDKSKLEQARQEGKKRPPQKVGETPYWQTPPPWMNTGPNNTFPQQPLWNYQPDYYRALIEKYPQFAPKTPGGSYSPGNSGQRPIQMNPNILNDEEKKKQQQIIQDRKSQEWKKGTVANSILGVDRWMGQYLREIQQRYQQWLNMLSQYYNQVNKRTNNRDRNSGQPGGK